MQKNNNIAKLSTAYSEFMPEMPWAVYPRPQLKRDSFFCLNGDWDFEVTSGEMPENFGRKIKVPFPPESALSGIDELFSEKSRLYYKKTFSLPEGFVKERVILHFGAVDQICKVYLNGEYIGSHSGGYAPFSFDVTDALKEQNTLIVKVADELSKQVFPYGKQTKRRGGMWYTRVSGIWQTVWLESVSKKHVTSLKVDTSLIGAEISVYGIDEGTVTVKTEGGEIKAELNGGKASISIPEPKLWSPENPYLYEFAVEGEGDRVESYFALRTIEIKEVGGKKRICLNGEPYFFHALLDQGYFPDGIFTPATPEAYKNDILEAKRLGFNTLRKHIKIEPQIFYYYCDKLGMVVFQDMVNNGHYSFLRDTALPTVAVKKMSDKLLHLNKKSREQFVLSMIETVKLLYNHPSICYWTIFNEGWGQFCSDEMYDLLKELDSTRIIDSTSGWFKNSKSDVESEHVYFKPYKFRSSDKAVVLSEFGGYSFRPEGHIFNLKKAYGYRFFTDRNEFENDLLRLYREEIIPAVKEGLCASVYTQLSDVEDETNGLLSYDRLVCKVDGKKMREIAAE
ncbi:MAG: glycoside hydrolase family 2, partial [Oscillospiraceae bacterium]|nr:glycoside hydrolase family 2 [Oscillospiraceae bacterium]